MGLGYCKLGSKCEKVGVPGNQTLHMDMVMALGMSAAMRLSGFQGPGSTKSHDCSSRSVTFDARAVLQSMNRRRKLRLRSLHENPSTSF